jgi:hypothetical protein
MIVVEIIFIVIVIYLVAGLLFSIPFILKGVSKIDEGARGATWGFRLIIIPGTMIFWPLLLKKWMATAKRKRHDKTAA